jgi:hypothetical protein
MANFLGALMGADLAARPLLSPEAFRKKLDAHIAKIK